MPRSPLTERYQRVMSLVEQLHALEPDERNFILDLLVPEAEPAKKSQKKSSKKRVGKGGGGGKSQRASTLAEKIQGTVSGKTGSGFCVYKPASGTVCNEVESNSVHHDTIYTDYHPFVPAAQSAASQSSANSGAASSTVNSATEKDAVGSVVQGVSGGD